EDAERKGDLTKEIIASVRTWKAEKKYPLNRELARIEIVGRDSHLLRGYEDDIAQTVRATVLELLEEAHLDSHPAVIKPVHAKLGPLFKNYAKEIVGQLATMDPSEALTLLDGEGIDLLMNDGRMVRITSDLVDIVCELQYQGKAVETLQVGDLLLVIEA
ncbi:MAG TPA: valine--tRNA ligase, partial [Methanomassiliicoccales archaeon]|nr:valine--tRNA ligase [Methanomassiliicoccales archaeon]